MKLTTISAAVISALLAVGCSSSNDSDDTTTSITHDLANMQKVLNTNADIAFATYSDSVDTANDLLDAIVAFRKDPSVVNHTAAKQAWLVAREPYGQTEVYRFRNSPIDDDPTTSAAEDGPEGDLNAWPLGEALIDYVSATTDDFGTDQVGVSAHAMTGVNGGNEIDAAHAEANKGDNIIGNTAITIDEALISQTATADDEHDVIAGYHAIEFLLWGQDLDNTGVETTSTDRTLAVKTNGASNYASGGDRSCTDFGDYTGAPLHTCAGGFDQDVSPIAYDATNLKHRRLKYLEVATTKLVADLTKVRDEWATGADYRTTFTTVADVDAAKVKMLEILTGMGTLSEGELAGERMQIALSSNSQEDEHSCFSDNTHRDIWLNAEGVSNAYRGSYAGYDSTLDGTDDVTTNAVDGYGLDDYLADLNQTDLADEVADALDSTETNYSAIDANARAGKPMDVVIVNPTGDDAKPMRDTIVSLNAQSSKIAKIATELDLGTADQVVDPDGSACDTTDPTTVCP